jgi:hypothetical protein
LAQVTADPVQRSNLIEGLDLTTPVAEIAEDAQLLF